MKSWTHTHTLAEIVLYTTEHIKHTCFWVFNMTLHYTSHQNHKLYFAIEKPVIKTKTFPSNSSYIIRIFILLLLMYSKLQESNEI